ncbi:hypothetical protein BT96DRAFT_949131 [Gymnopus androsaceus JB14]|uniref:Uncharacterized protein n=1 Tax=Gymnopus androsaceus JB14 TaxID=1447944 RepID=A0A6A4GL55_9AGAR|nr:hypothetical protein BT96DRAFT_949131 [Gymnopus androsaceus JB14]
MSTTEAQEALAPLFFGLYGITLSECYLYFKNYYSSDSIQQKSVVALLFKIWEPRCNWLYCLALGTLQPMLMWLVQLKFLPDSHMEPDKDDTFEPKSCHFHHTGLNRDNDSRYLCLTVCNHLHWYCSNCIEAGKISFGFWYVPSAQYTSKTWGIQGSLQWVKPPS